MINTNFSNTITQLNFLKDSKTEDEFNTYYSTINNDLSNNFNILQSKIDIYNDQLDMNNRLSDLISKYQDKQNIVTDNNYNAVKSITTNDRKSYYESQEYDYLITWNKRLWFFYYITAIILIFILFFSKNTLELNYKIAASVGLIIYPFTISYILIPVVYIFKFIYGLIPKNVYNSL